MIEHVDMGVDVPVEVHRHEARQLQEAGIDEPTETGMREGYDVEAIAAEPFDAAPLGEEIDGGRAAPGVDRAAHQRHRGGNVLVVLGLHPRDRGDQRHRGLADADGMSARTHDRQHLLIPEGTFILGDVQKVAGLGQKRLAVTFHRMLMPDGYSVDLDQFHGLG